MWSKDDSNSAFGLIAYKNSDPNSDIQRIGVSYSNNESAIINIKIVTHDLLIKLFDSLHPARIRLSFSVSMDRDEQMCTIKINKLGKNAAADMHSLFSSVNQTTSNALDKTTVDGIARDLNLQTYDQKLDELMDLARQGYCEQAVNLAIDAAKEQKFAEIITAFQNQLENTDLHVTKPTLIF